MALLDFLKNKEDAQKSKQRPVKKVEKVSDAKESKVSEVSAPKAVATSSGSFSYDVIKEPHISEKSTVLNNQNTYVFRVDNKSNKLEIKKAIEGIYGVNVTGVTRVTVPPKKRRVGRTQGYKKGYVKAMVTIKEGQKIELF